LFRAWFHSPGTRSCPTVRTKLTRVRHGKKWKKPEITMLLNNGRACRKRIRGRNSNADACWTGATVVCTSALWNLFPCAKLSRFQKRRAGRTFAPHSRNAPIGRTKTNAWAIGDCAITSSNGLTTNPQAPTGQLRSARAAKLTLTCSRICKPSPSQPFRLQGAWSGSASIGAISCRGKCSACTFPGFVRVVIWRRRFTSSKLPTCLAG